MLAAINFEGIEKDNYYIIQIILEGNYKKFSNEQRKQIDTYVKELNLIYTFFLLNGNPNKINKIDLTLLGKSGLSINIPFSKFKSLETYSGNTYSRIINALNKFMVDSWALAFDHVICYNREVATQLQKESRMKKNS